MRHSIFIHLPVTEQQQLVWAERTDQVYCRTEHLETVAKMAIGKRVVAIIPGSDLWLTRVDAPQTNRGNMEKAVPFLLEEQLSCPVEDLHFAMGKRQKDGTLPVAILARHTLTQWLTTLHAVGIQPEAMVGEQQLLPWKPGSWTVCLTTTKAIVRTDSESGFGLDPFNLEQLLALALQETLSPPDYLHVLDYSNGKLAIHFDGLSVPVQMEQKNGEPLAILIENFKPGSALNLLQGTYAPIEWSIGWWRPLRLTAMLLIGWLLLRGGHTLMESQHLAQQTQDLDQQIEAQFRTAFPDAQRIVDPQAQMNQKLQALRQTHHPKTDSGFLALMAHTGTVLQPLAGVTLKRIQFQDDKLDIFLHLPDLQQLDQIRQALTKDAAFAATIQNANKSKEGVESNLRIFKQ